MSDPTDLELEPLRATPNEARLIALTYDEVCLACFHGLMRRMAKIRGQRGDRPQGERSTWENEMEGSCAEMAYNKIHNVFWAGLAGLRATDAGRGDEVRWTRHENTGGLIVYRHDDDEKRYVLMDGFAPRFRIIGWLYASEGKRDEFWDDRYGYYLVPRQFLYSPRELFNAADNGRKS